MENNSVFSLDKIALVVIVGAISIGLACLIVANTNSALFCEEAVHNDTYYVVSTFNDSLAQLNITIAVPGGENHDTYIKVAKTGMFTNGSFIIQGGYGTIPGTDIENVYVDVGDNGIHDFYAPGNFSNNQTIILNTSVGDALFAYTASCLTEYCDVPISVNTSSMGTVRLAGLNVTYTTSKDVLPLCDGDEGVIAGTNGAFENFANFLPIIIVVILAGVIITAVGFGFNRGR